MSDLRYILGKNEAFAIEGDLDKAIEFIKDEAGLMSGQEWLSKTLHIFYEHAQGDYFRDDKQFKASTVTMAEVEVLLQKAAGIE